MMQIKTDLDNYCKGMDSDKHVVEEQIEMWQQHIKQLKLQASHLLRSEARTVTILALPSTPECSRGG